MIIKEMAPRRVIIIDDTPSIHDDYRKILSGNGGRAELDGIATEFFGTEEVQKREAIQFEIDSAFQGQDGLKKIIDAVDKGQPYALAFVDMRMPPGWDGLKTVKEIWKVAPDTQIVICTAYCDKTWQEICDHLGTTDRLLILKKPFEGIEVVQLAIAMTEKWRVTKEANLNLQDLELLVDERTAELQFAAQRDALTGVANRKHFNNQLFQSLKAGERLGHSVAVMILDIDYFKSINDTFGHPAGDSVICAVADRIRRCIRDSDTVARLGGDEFAIIQSPIQSPELASALAERVSDLINQPLVINGETFNVQVSIGLSLSPVDGTEPSRLLKNADLALYRAKADGRNCCRFFKPEFDRDSQNRRENELRLKNAIQKREFELYYQPQFSTTSQELTGFEALVRWNDPERGLVPPDAFIRLAEESGLIVSLGKWVLEEACATAAKWPKHIRIAVNVSAIQILQKDFCETVSQALSFAHLDPKRLEVEITESVLLRDGKETLNTLREIKETGTRIVMDDFGTGYSSLGYLRSFPFDKLKLDRSFVKDLADAPEAQEIVRAVASIGQCLGMETTAEGVETEAQLMRVAEAGYTQIQGYLKGKPMPISQVNQIYFPPVQNSHAKIMPSTISNLNFIPVVRR